MQDSAQTSPNQDQQIFLYRTGIKESQLPLTSVHVVSPLNSDVLSAAGATAGAAPEAAELRKHTASDAKCTELGWVSIPLVVESYEARGKEAQQCLSRLASRLAIHNSMATFELYARLKAPDEGKLYRAMLSSINLQVCSNHFIYMFYQLYV
eukprot:Em0019g174a